MKAIKDNKSQDKFLKAIVKDLEKTGFASEMRAMKAFISQSWRTSGNRSYFDLDENKTREIDFSAYNTLTEYHPQTKEIIGQSFFQVVAEVKKTDKPWIIFRENPHNAWKLQEGWSSLICCAGLSDKRDRKILTDILLTSGWGYHVGWFGYGVHEAFKPPQQPSRWYEALVKVCKSGEDILKANSFKKHSYPYFFFVKPLVVVDGELISVYLDEKANIKAEQINAAMIDFDFSTTNYKESRYTIDIVSLNYLPNYIEFCELRHKKIFDELKQHCVAKTTQTTR